MTRVRRLSFIVVLVAMVAFAAPHIALAVGPVTTPEVLVTEGFESPVPVTYATTPYAAGGGVTPGYWATWTKQHHSGLASLWCDGTNLTQAARTVPQYAEGSQGYATFALPQAANYYRPVASFYYMIPSRGTEDANSFAPQWSSDAQAPTSWYNGLWVIANPPPSAWATATLDLSVYETNQPGESLSRNAGRFRFLWRDALEVDPNAPARTGQGPSVDDVTISAWMFGSVRSLAATTTSISTTLTWARPYRSTRESIVEERPLSFRVYRALKSAPTAWTEITTTTPRPVQAGNNFSFTDTTVVDGTAYTYAVQPWAPGSSETTGFGQHMAIDATTNPLTGLSVRIAAPAGNTSATPLPGKNAIPVFGSVGVVVPAATVKLQISAVRLPLPPQYWNGTAWQPAQTSTNAPVTSTTWSTSFNPLPGDDHRYAYTLTATATDGRNVSVNSPSVVVYADKVAPRLLSARSLGSFGVELRFSERLYSSPANVALSTLATPYSTPYFSVKGMKLDRGVWTADGVRVRFRTSRQATGEGGWVAVGDVGRLGPIRDFAGNVAPLAP